MTQKLINLNRKAHAAATAITQRSMFKRGQMEVLFTRGSGKDLTLRTTIVAAVVLASD